MIKNVFLFAIGFMMISSSYAQSTVINLPVTFDDSNVNYGLTDFGGNASMIMADPAGGTNQVVQSMKSNTAALWAGTTIGGTIGFASALPLTANAHTMTMRIYSPDAGIQVRMKVEDPSNPGISVETEATTTTSNAWETLTFDFATQAPGTAAINYANTYQKLSMFFNFGVDGATAGNKTYYWDDVTFGSGSVTPVLNLPVTFDDSNINYDLVDFGGNGSTIMADPAGGTNMVTQSIKGAGAQLWAGTTIGGTAGFATAIPFTANAHTITMRIYSPDAGIQVRMKTEDPANPGISVETEATTTTSNAWETLTFDFSTQAAGTAAINYANTYQKLSVFFNFGVDGATAGSKTYYWDDVTFGSGVVTPVLNLPVTFDDSNINYDLVDFGGNASMIMTDPTGGTNMVTQSIKGAGAQTWAGTTIGGTAGFATAVPFTANAHTITMRIYSPDAGTHVRMKVEDPANPGISVETEAITTTSNAWETLTFDFSVQAAGTAAINYSNTYQKLSVFFNFGVDGATAGSKTYYWDDVQFGSGVTPAGLNLPVTFDDTALNYDLVDFGGNASVIMVDPTGGTNLVAQSIKSNSAQVWAGTTIGGSTGGFTTAIPFAAGATTISMRVYSPTVGTPILLKAEDATNGAISVEVTATTTVANAWETLVFDFANGTPALNFANSYKKLSAFFNFGTDGATAGTQTYYWDDVQFGGTVANVINLPVTFESTTLNYELTDFGGNASTIMVDPAGGTNKVTQSIKTAGAQTWAGTTIAGTTGFGNAVPFTAADTKMTMRIYSPDAGIQIRMKVEDAANPGITVETEATTTTSNAWETLEFNFANQAAGTAALNTANTYNKASVFFNFGVDGATAGAKTYYWDDVQFGGIVTPPTGIDLPVTFDDATLNYDLVDFGGNASVIMTDPTGGTNQVAQSIKTAGAQLWAGTTIGGTVGFATAIPFTSTASIMSMRVYSPDAGIQVRMKVENPNDPTISVETEATTTVANGWETLVFDFANQAAGTAAINYANTYKKLSVFFNFGVDGATAGAKTYYWDDVRFGLPPVVVTHNVTFQVSGPDSLPVYLFGSWNAWSNFPGVPMASVGNGTYSVTVPLDASTNYEYLFVNGGTPVQEDLDPTMTCTNLNTQFTNRVIAVGTADTTVCFQWATCNACGVGTTTVNAPQIGLIMSQDGIRLISNEFNQVDQLDVFDILGRTVYSSTSKVGVNTLISTELHANTIYLARVKVNGQTLVYKGIITN